MVRVAVDTNVVLRFLLADHAERSPRAAAMFESAAAGRVILVLGEIVIAEAVWVLSSVYGSSREDIASVLTVLLSKPGIECGGAQVVLGALRRFAASTCDYADCHLAEFAVVHGMSFASFDRDLSRFGDVELWPVGDEH